MGISNIHSISNRTYYEVFSGVIMVKNEKTKVEKIIRVNIENKYLIITFKLIQLLF